MNRSSRLQKQAGRWGTQGIGLLGGGGGGGVAFAEGAARAIGDLETIVQTANQSYSLLWRPYPTPVARFELRSGDHWQAEATKDRSEFQVTDPIFAYDTDYWISQAFYIDIANSTDTNFATISQGHQTPDGGDITTASPNFEITFRPSDGQMRITTRYSAEDPLTVSGAATIQYFSVIARKKWHYLVNRLRFSKTAALAQLESWFNGVRVVNNAAASIGYVDVVGPYWKWGYYRSAATYTGIVYHANMEVGTASLAARIAAPTSIIAGLF